MSPKVSVLVPVYNVSSHIEKCAHSLFNQTFVDVEFVFINDATPDDSIEKLMQVINQYPQRKAQIKIINHSFNRGLAAARNTAIDNSTGEYIAVVDSDDYIDTNMIEELYKCAEKENADIVVSDIMMESQYETHIFSDFVSNDKETNIKCMIENDISYAYLWNKLVRRELYERPDCRVPEGLNYLEDRHVMTRLYFYATKIAKVNKPFYHYILYNQTSISKNKNQMHFENVLQFWMLLDAFLIEHNLYDEYQEIIDLSKIGNKTRLMFETSSTKVRKKYANIFLTEEKKYFSQLKRGEKLMLLLIRYKLFFLTQWFRQAHILKNKFRQFFLFFSA